MISETEKWKNKNRSRSFVMMFLGMLGLLLLLWGRNVWYKAKPAKIGTDLSPEGVVQVFQDAGIEIRELTDAVYYPADYSGECGMAFTITIEREAYHILVARYADWEEAKYVTQGSNGLDESMHGGYVSAFHYGPIYVHVFPSNAGVSDKLRTMLEEME